MISGNISNYLEALHKISKYSLNELLISLFSIKITKDNILRLKGKITLNSS